MLRSVTTMVCLALLASAAGMASAAGYEVTDVTPGWTASLGGATAVNATGEVAGWGYNPGGSISSFVYSAGTVTDLGKDGFSSQSRCFGINNAGTMAGWGLVPMKAWYETSGGTMTTLPYLSGGTSAQGFAIDNAGEIAGYSMGTTSSGVIAQATIWNGGTPYDLDTLGSVNGAFQLISNHLSAINNSGQAVGTATIGVSSGGPPTPTFEPVYYTYSITGGVLTGTASNLTSAVGYGYANGINDHNQIVGQSGSHAYVYNIGGSVTNLGYLGAGTYSTANAINNSGLVVGYSYIDTAETVEHAFIYNGAATMIDLNSLIDPASGWTLTSANAINGDYIVGTGTLGGVAQGFCIALLPGDANLDGRVDINDLTIVLGNYGSTSGTWAQGDFNGDARVDINDLTIVLGNYNASASQSGALASVPEPSALLLTVAGLVGFLACAWRKIRAPRG